MLVYLSNIVLTMCWAALLLWHEPNQFKRRLFCGLASAQWILLSGLRHISVGADTYAYKWYSFVRLESISWWESLEGVWGTYFGSLAIKDPGYRVVVKTSQLVSHDYQVFLLLVAIAFTVPLGIFIYRYSADPLMSFLIYSCLFSSFFAITGIRQAIATVLVVLVGYRYVVSRRLLPFALLCVVAFTIHKSAVVFAPFYFIANLKVTRYHVLAVLAFAPVVFFFRGPLTLVSAGILGYEQYASQVAGAGAWVFAAMLVLVTLVAMWRLPVIVSDDPLARGWFNATLMAVLLSPIVFVNPNAMRVVQYYSIFLLLLVPGILRSFRIGDEQVLAYIVSASALIFLFMRTTSAYLFFWQGP